MTALKHEFSWKLPSPPETVFAALTEPAQLATWFAEHAEVEPRAGGAYRFWGRHTYGTPTRDEATQRIEQIDPPRSLAYSWRLAGRESSVTLGLEPDTDTPGGSVLSGVHEFADAPALERAPELIDDLWRLNWGNLFSHLLGTGGLLLPDYTSSDPEIRLSIFIAASPAQVYGALIDPAQVEAWFGAPATIEPRVGGQYRIGIGDDAPPDTPHQILELVENERLAIQWPDWRGDPAVPPQRVTWTLTPENGGTHVELVHDGFVRPADISDYPFGWGHFLTRIRDLAEGKPLEPQAH